MLALSSSSNRAISRRIRAGIELPRISCCSPSLDARRAQLLLAERVSHFAIGAVARRAKSHARRAKGPLAEPPGPFAERVRADQPSSSTLAEPPDSLAEQPCLSRPCWPSVLPCSPSASSAGFFACLVSLGCFRDRFGVYFS